ncbi:MAG: LPS export ABC transporter periplasmic protein LptC [Armatimonadota bacterium]
MQHHQWILLVAAVLSLAMFSGCAQQTAKQRTAKPKPPVAKANDGTDPFALKGIKIEGKGYELVFPNQGERYWKIEFESIEGDAETEMMKLTGVSGELIEKDKVTLRVTADVGATVMKDKAARFDLSGHVTVIEPARRMNLTADRFRWTSDAKGIAADNLVLTGRGFTHRATHGTFTPDLAHGVFTGSVRTEGNGAATIARSKE